MTRHYRQGPLGGEKIELIQPPSTTAKDTNVENGTTSQPQKKRLHKATWATDKKNPGGFLIRIAGPTASAFAGRTVPVTRKDDSESMEELTTCIWAGTDEETKQPVALYRFKAKPKDEAAEADLPF